MSDYRYISVMSHAKVCQVLPVLTFRCHTGKSLETRLDLHHEAKMAAILLCTL